MTSRHKQISDALREKITSGIFAVNDKLPSENALGEEFDVSRITVRRALQTLVGEGLIVRKQGIGTFVRERKLRQGLYRLTDFVEDMENAGREPSSEVLYAGSVTAGPWAARMLDMTENDMVWQLDRLRKADGEVIAFDRTWMPVFYADLIHDFDLTQRSIYSILERDFKVPIVSGKYRIEAVCVEADLAVHLGIEPGSGALRIDRITATERDRVVYYQQRTYRGDRMAYELNLVRDPRYDYLPNTLVIQDFEPIVS